MRASLVAWLLASGITALGFQNTDVDRSLFFLLQSSVVILNEIPDFIRHAQKLVPLLPIKRHREAPQPVYGQAALFAHLERHLPAHGFLQRLILSAEALDLSLQFFFRCHAYQ